MGILLVYWGMAASLAWCLLTVRAIVAGRRIEWLRDLRPREPERWPRLSVVFAARDEAATLTPAVLSLLAQDYPDLDVVAVNDRSTDGSGPLLDRLAAGDPRLRVAHVRDLPEGWLGKVHALDRGRAAARGEWLLFTDADVHFSPGVLRKTVAVSLERGLDHLTVAPGLRSPSFWCQVAMAAFGEEFIRGTRADRVGDPRSDAYVGIGAFNLVRREALDRTPGFEWLRMEVLDDVGLALMLKRSGAKNGFLIGKGDLEVTWYLSLAAMGRGLEKNLFGMAARYGYGRLLLVELATIFFALGLPAAVLAPSARARALATLALLLHLAKSALTSAKSGIPFRVLALTPASVVLMSFWLLRSGYRCLREGGITWRGTFYPVEALRAGQRVRL